MVKLYLQESGSVRAFKLGNGVARIGSGEKANLRLDAKGLADVHLELEVGDQGVLVRPMPGVLPPMLNGEPLEAESALGHRQAVVVGDVVLWVDADDSKSTRSPLDDQPTKAVAGSAIGQDLAKGKFQPRAKGPRKNTKANYRGKQRVIESKRRRVERGLPSGLVVGGGLLLLLVVFFVVRNRITASNSHAIFSVSKMLDTVEEKMRSTSIHDARIEFNRIHGDLERTDEEAARMRDIRLRLDEMQAQEIEMQANLIGSKYLDTKLKRYEKSQLLGDPSHAKIRLFLMRTQEFKRRWPSHKDMAWVERMEARFSSAVDVSAPPSLDDIVWEIKYIDSGENRNFKHAFALIDDVSTRVSGAAKDSLERLRLRTIAARDEHFKGRMDKVHDVVTHFDSVVKPVGWMLHLVLWCGDEGLADKAAHKLISLEGADACLRGYEFTYPDLYREILAHPVVGEYAREKHIIP